MYVNGVTLVNINLQLPVPVIHTETNIRGIEGQCSVRHPTLYSIISGMSC